MATPPDMMKQQAALISGGSAPAMATPESTGVQQSVLDQMMEMVRNSVPPEQRQNIPGDFAAMGSIQKDVSEGKSRREIVYETLQGRTDTLNQKKKALLIQMSSDAPMSKSQIAAMMLIGILPTIVGGAIKGKQGIAAGAQAGQLGASTMAAGIEADKAKEQALAKLEYKDLEDQAKRIQDTQDKLQLAGLNSQEQDARAEAANATRLTAAGISASGMSSGLKGIGQALDNNFKELRNEKASQESKSAAHAFKTDEREGFMPLGNVDPKKAEEAKQIGGSYINAIRAVKDVQSTIDQMDAGVLDRVAGESSDLVHKKIVFAREEIKKAMDLSGKTSDKRLQKLDSLLADPSSLVGNIIAAGPKSATVSSQLTNSLSVLKQAQDSYMGTSGFTKVRIGQQMLLSGKPVQISDILPNGQVKVIPIQLPAATTAPIPEE